MGALCLGLEVGGRRRHRCVAWAVCSTGGVVEHERLACQLEAMGGREVEEQLGDNVQHLQVGSDSRATTPNERDMRQLQTANASNDEPREQKQK